jgi:flagellar motor switch protein FliN/FliY
MSDDTKSFSEDLPKIDEVPNLDSDHLVGVRDLDAIYDVSVNISAVLGQADMPVNQLLKLGRGAVVELDRKVGEAIDIYVNNKLIARGEVMVVGEHLGITMTEIIKSDKSQSK